MATENDIAANGVEVGRDFWPDYYAVYVIRDRELGYFAGFKAFSNIPIFCPSIKGAVKYDAFENLAARVKALAVRDCYVKGATVLAFKRFVIYPEKFKKGKSHG